MVKKARVLGLDIGEKRIGVAMSDPEMILASPLAIIKRDKDSNAFAAIAELVDKHGVARVVAGLPLSLKGHAGPQVTRTKAFVEGLSNHIEVPVSYRDERLSTVLAEQLLASRKKRGQKIHSDAAAAAVILQSYLDDRR